ncbi:hypothetical protein Csa_020923 [Cucumis sativus]|nr:hypothetical protein Csa_020923 [Cucumis sativus]
MVKEAVQEDNSGNYAKAFLLYMKALESFKTHFKYEKNPNIKEAITLKFNQYLHPAEVIRVPSRAFLLYGPLGTGKLAKAISTLADSTFFSISCSDLVSKWVEKTEKLVIVLSKLFEMACDSAPSITLIDEIDYLCGRGGECNENEAFRRIKTELLMQMQAIRRQFDERIYIPLPDLNARQYIFKVHLGDTPNNLTEGGFESLTLRTEEMYSNFKEQAIEYVKQAVHEDNAGNYAKAFPLYMNALEYFKTHLKYEKNPKIKEAITQKFTEYLRRAEEIRAVLDDGGPGPASNGDAAVATKPKTKPKDGEGGDGEDPEQAKLRAGLNSAIIREKPDVKWNDVAGLESAKQALQEAVILPVKFPQFFTGKRRPWRAFLLYGPPGTGKSYLAKAVATEADSTFFSISSSDLVSKWMGESEKLVSNLFQMARDSAPSIIFIDEIDSLCGQRGEGNESEASRRIKTELLVQMQGVGHNDQKVLVLAATNTPYALDQAIRRRFDKRIYIPLPDLKARQHMFKVHLGDTPHNLTEADFENLARKTDGFSGSDISVCVKDVLFEPVRKTQDAMFFIMTPDGMWVPCGPKQQGAVQISMQELAAKGLASKILPPPITRTDFDKVLARQRPTVSKSDLEIHERFTKEFGEEG